MTRDNQLRGEKKTSRWGTAYPTFPSQQPPQPVIEGWWPPTRPMIVDEPPIISLFVQKANTPRILRKHLSDHNTLPKLITMSTPHLKSSSLPSVMANVSKEPLGAAPVSLCFMSVFLLKASGRHEAPQGQRSVSVTDAMETSFLSLHLFFSYLSLSLLSNMS